jgi:outer membrane receptor protein involved in Fe transport
MKTTARRQLLATTLLMGMGAFATPAFAQEEDRSRTDQEAAGAQVPVESGVDTSDAQGDQENITVTGSRISRPDLEASSPVTVITGEALEISGTTSVEEYLRDVPQAVSAIGSNTNNGNPGVATVSLRNLGEERTLVLVDGRRFIAYDSNLTVDLNMIPTSLIERVDILTGGASSVYGSDAIAGVVNFILRSDFEGFEADAQSAVTQRGDGAEYNFSVTAGVNSGDGRGNFVVNFGYTTSEAVYQGQRDFSRNVLSAATLGAGGGSATNAAGTVRGLSAALCGGFNPNDVGVCVFDAAGNLRPYNRNADGFNFNPFNLLKAPAERWTGTALGRYEITDAIEFFTRMSFANTRVTTIVAPSGTFNFPFDIRYAAGGGQAANPFLSAQARAVLAASDPTPGDGVITVPLGRRTLEIGTRDSIYENTAYQIVGGFRGHIVEGLDWEAFAQWGRTSRTQTFANDISFARTQACITAGTCNLFGPGNLTQAAGNAIRLDLQQYDTTSQLMVGGFLSYDLPFVLGGTKSGGVVVGAEYRRDSGTANPDENLIQGNAPGFGSSTPIDARIDVNEIYAEARIPFFDMFSVEGGIRFSNYKNRDNLTGQGNEFDATSWKIGGDFEPIPDLRFRAVYQRAVRAPNLNEIGQPFTPSTGDANTDPCSSANTTPAQYTANTGLAPLCVATGVPRARGIAGTVGGPISGQINNFVGGNIGLTPEEAETLTAGVVFQPTFFRGFTASVDYFDIQVDNAIFQVPEQETIDACYNTEKNASGFFCSRIRRNPLDGSLIGGTETGVVSTRINAATFRTTGVDVNLAYTFDFLADSRLTLAINAVHTIRSEFRSAALTPLRECEGLLGDICLRPQPKWQFVQTSTFVTGPFTAQLRWRYIGELTQNQIAFGTAPASDFAVPTIEAHHYFDLFTKYDINDNMEFRLGVNNLLDQDPPTVGNDYGGTTENSGNTFPATYDPLGRSFFVGVNLRF